MIERKVKETIIEHNLIEKGDHIIIGLSGGPDSVCLFSVMQSIRKEFNLQIYAVHVNHQFRPGAADEDQNYVEKLCENAGIPCHVFTFDCNRIAREQGVTSEEAGRNVRYESFFKAANRLIKEKAIPAGKIKIAVAQNKNDQAETVLMRIIRGTGTDGLAGIEYAREGEFGTTVIRPLLDVNRKEILAYCEKYGLNPCMDHTNELPLYTRNKIRLELIPLIKRRFNENIVESLTRLSQISREDKAFLWKQARQAFDSLTIRPALWENAPHFRNAVYLDRTGLMDLDTAIRHRVLLMAFKEIGLKQDISALHLKAADHIIESQNVSASLDFPEGFQLIVSYGAAAVCHPSAEGTSFLKNYVLTSKILDINELKEIKGQGPSSVAAFDEQQVLSSLEHEHTELVLRTRQPGDFFRPKGMKGGRKKLQDYFVDQQIPRQLRDQHLLVCIGKEVIWIFEPFLREYSRINENYNIRQDTKRVLMLEIRKKL